MQISSVNVGEKRDISTGRSPFKTGIFKEPVSEPVRVTVDGVQGDAVVNRKHHGGPDQAVYVYGAPDYAWWSRELGRELAPGTFGENLIITGVESASVRIGDRFRIGNAEGEVVLEVTAPRIPCSTLAARMGTPTFVKRFMQADRPGFYCRVLQEGAVRVGDEVAFELHSGETVTLVELYRDLAHPELTEAAIRRFLAAPIAERARAYKERQLAELLGTG